ncbi:Probable inorganic phosphate transporter 1-9 [Ancistrocladus abbreviatus]
MGLKVLSALDTARTQYYHFKAIIIAGMGLFTDAYDLFSISPIMQLVGHIYYSNVSGPSQFQIPPVVNSVMIGIPLLGTAIGQLLFGRLGDLGGRRRVYGLALLLMILSSFGCGFSICTTRTCVLSSLGFFRFLLGIGIGGDYPLSATVMSEFANKRTRGAFIAAVFSMQGFGILASSVVTMIVCAIFNHATSHPTSNHAPQSTDLAWRIILMIGAIPGALTLYWRMLMPETARYTALVERNVMQAAKDMEKVMDVSINQIVEDPGRPIPLPSSTYPLLSKQFLHRHGSDLFGCSATWFLLDIVFYSNAYFQSKIYDSYFPKKGNAFDNAYNMAKLQAIIAICSTIPGYWASVYFIERMGRVKIQIMGFVLMGAGLFAIGGPYYGYLGKGGKLGLGFMFLYGLTFFFSNFGPNTTTFIVPAELFPARFRSTCHGIAGAAGKVGALIGSVGFLWASHKHAEQGYPKGIGMTAVLVIMGVFCLVGAAVTYLFIPETKGRSLEENESEAENETDVEVEINGRQSSPQVFREAGVQRF